MTPPDTEIRIIDSVSGGVTVRDAISGLTSIRAPISVQPQSGVTGRHGVTIKTTKTTRTQFNLTLETPADGLQHVRLRWLLKKAWRSCGLRAVDYREVGATSPVQPDDRGNKWSNTRARACAIRYRISGYPQSRRSNTRARACAIHYRRVDITGTSRSNTRARACAIDHGASVRPRRLLEQYARTRVRDIRIPSVLLSNFSEQYARTRVRDTWTLPDFRGVTMEQYARTRVRDTFSLTP